MQNTKSMGQSKSALDQKAIKLTNTMWRMCKHNKETVVKLLPVFLQQNQTLIPFDMTSKEQKQQQQVAEAVLSEAKQTLNELKQQNNEESRVARNALLLSLVPPPKARMSSALAWFLGVHPRRLQQIALIKHKGMGKKLLIRQSRKDSTPPATIKVGAICLTLIDCRWVF